MLLNIGIIIACLLLLIYYYAVELPREDRRLLKLDLLRYKLSDLYQSSDEITTTEYEFVLDTIENDMKLVKNGANISALTDSCEEEEKEFNEMIESIESKNNKELKSILDESNNIIRKHLHIRFTLFHYLVLKPLIALFTIIINIGERKKRTSYSTTRNRKRKFYGYVNTITDFITYCSSYVTYRKTQ